MKCAMVFILCTNMWCTKNSRAYHEFLLCHWSLDDAPLHLFLLLPLILCFVCFCYYYHYFRQKQFSHLLFIFYVHLCGKIMNYFFDFDAHFWFRAFYVHARHFCTLASFDKSGVCAFVLVRSAQDLFCRFSICYWLYVAFIATVHSFALCSIVDFVHRLCSHFFFTPANIIYFIDFDIWTTTDINNLLFN